jgi:hypothetical protein
MASISNAPSRPICYSDPNWESVSNVDILPTYRYSSCSELKFSTFDSCVDQLGEINCVPLHQMACKRAISALTSIAAEEACCECGGGVAYSESPSLSPSEPTESVLSIPIIAGAAGGGLLIGILITVFIMNKKRKRKQKKKRRHHEHHEDHTPNKQDVSKAWEIAASRVRKHNRHRKPQEKPTISESKKQKKNSKEESKHKDNRKKLENYRKQNDPRDRRETFVEDDYRNRRDVESQYAKGSTVQGFYGGHSRFDEMMTNSIRNLFQNR